MNIENVNKLDDLPVGEKNDESVYDNNVLHATVIIIDAVQHL